MNNNKKTIELPYEVKKAYIILHSGKKLGYFSHQDFDNLNRIIKKYPQYFHKIITDIK